MKNEINKFTLAVHGGEEKNKYADSLINPIVQTSTYSFKNTKELCDYMDGKHPREEYGRYGNPTLRVAQNKLASLDHGIDSILFSSGMTAVCVTLLSLVEEDSHIIITNDSYRRTRQFVRDVLSKFGVEYSVVDPTIKSIESAIQENTTLIFSESPTNPYLRVLDLKGLAEITKKKNIISIIDSTFATPYNQTPLDYGIDLVIHSATKYLGGHNDLMAGVVIGNSDYLLEQIKQYRNIFGGLLDPNSSYLLIRGLKTFALRIQQQNNSGLKLAQYLESHPKILCVHYPGLESHPDYRTAKEQLKGFGGLISFEIDGDIKRTGQFIDNVKIPFIAPSLGGVESLIEQVCLMSYYEMTTKERLEVGIKENLVRYSVGIEDVNDLIADIDQALSKI